MGWFDSNKSDKRTEEIPSLPELPALPEFPRIREETKLPRLPTYPSNTFGEKFSQSAIKEAISGEKEDEFEVSDADEFALDEDRMQMMQKPLKGIMTREIDGERIPRAREISDEEEIVSREFPRTRVPEHFTEAARKVRRAEPVFIRIDKFEESLKTFEETKKKISEIERLLKDISRVKEEEEKELNAWQENIQTIKKKIDKIDSEIFSKLE